MHTRDRKFFRKIMVGRQNVHIYLKWAAVHLMLRTTALEYHGPQTSLYKSRYKCSSFLCIQQEKKSKRSIRYLVQHEQKGHFYELLPAETCTNFKWLSMWSNSRPYKEQRNYQALAFINFFVKIKALVSKRSVSL